MVTLKVLKDNRDEHGLPTFTLQRNQPPIPRITESVIHGEANVAINTIQSVIQGEAVKLMLQYTINTTAMAHIKYYSVLQPANLSSITLTLSWWLLLNVGLV